MADTLGGRIAEARKSAGRTQEWLGEQTDSNRGSVIAWEKPDGNPSSKNLQKIIAALGVSGHWLIMGEGTMRDTPHQNAQTLGRMQAVMRDHLSATQDPQDQSNVTAPDAERLRDLGRVRHLATDTRGKKKKGGR